ncbi:MAG: hypothetical protein FWE84_01250 [Firmicutes bacterium]|nr:hypothetical protein [Bacillota bacterium]
MKYDKDFAEDLVAEVKEDYLLRREGRRHFEAQWQLNSNFLSGNQYCAVSLAGNLEDRGKDYYWQEREVFNHIAFIVETRLAKLNRVRPVMAVRAAGSEESDAKTAKLSTKILRSASDRLNLQELMQKGAQWSETVGSVFYKVSWDKSAGKKVGILEGSPVHEGEVRVDVCPSYEIFPDSLSYQDVSDCQSIIHAKAVAVDDIFRIYGAMVDAEDVDTVSLASAGVSGGMGMTGAVIKHGRGKTGGHTMVIERYSAPSANHPDGEFAVVAGNKLLHYGPLPFRLGEDGSYALPFIKQDSLSVAGCFFGASIVERAIPVQRAYNAVKNRKHEFLNRIAMGVLAVEDGSVDTENLETEGLSPGKILVYRQGSTPPALLDPGSVPAEFADEEDKLLNEFVLISGISEIMRSSALPGNLSSGAAIRLLTEQDDTRLSATAERIRMAGKKLAQFILRLYKQFASQPRLSRVAGDGGRVELLSFIGSDLCGDDVVIESENEFEGGAQSRRLMLLELFKVGLFEGENGVLSAGTRAKLLEALGFGTLAEEVSVCGEGGQRNE